MCNGVYRTEYLDLKIQPPRLGQVIFSWAVLGMNRCTQYRLDWWQRAFPETLGLNRAGTRSSLADLLQVQSLDPFQG